MAKPATSAFEIGAEKDRAALGPGGNDVNFAMDAPPVDSTLVDELRSKGAIIYAKSVASLVTNTRSSTNRSTC